MCTVAVAVGWIGCWANQRIYRYKNKGWHNAKEQHQAIFLLVVGPPRPDLTAHAIRGGIAKMRHFAKSAPLE